MYTMLLEEITWAVEEKEPYAFTHYLILSKTYVEVASTLTSYDDGMVDDAGGDKAGKKKKKKLANGAASAAALDGGETFFFHPEDEVWARYAVATGSWEYETPADEGASDAKRAFQELGVKPRCHLILLEAARFGEAVAKVQEFLAG